METLSHGRKMCPLQTLLVYKAFTLVPSSRFVPNQCEFCELIHISFLFQGLCSPLISFCLLVAKILRPLCFSLLPIPGLHFQYLMWFPVHSAPLFLPQAFFPNRNICSVSATLTPDLSYLFSRSCSFGSPWPARGQFSIFSWKLQFIIMPESYPLPCGSCTF